MKEKKLKVDQNLEFFDFVKMNHAEITAICFQTLNKFQKDQKRLPKIWDFEDAEKFLEISN